MNEPEFASLLVSVYAVASQELEWKDLSTPLNHYFDADWSKLGHISDESCNDLFSMSSSGSRTKFNRPSESSRGNYRGDFSEQVLLNARDGREAVRCGGGLNSPFVADSVWHEGSADSLVARVQGPDPAMIGLFRDTSRTPFGESERRALDRLVPHLGRAMTLRRKLDAGLSPHVRSFGTLDNVALPVACVTEDLSVIYANAAGEAMLTGSGELGVRLGQTRSAGKARACLEVADQQDAAALRRHVRSVINNGPGGCVGIRPAPSSLHHPWVTALFISRVPAGAMDVAPDAGRQPAALIVAQDMTRRLEPPEDVMQGVFGLTTSECSVAKALVGGASASDVAQARRVSVETVRTQIREVLRKTGARNLRDFERIAGSATAASPLAMLISQL